ncbi:ABC transporter ATP-binding protein [Shouchella sp. 1P09AA]|uniref:ABC transporter ATP-binding protein n=1 Tax=unclassified Shouchella TaxID=2893065 RepID=UPI0039A39D1C
MSALLEVQALHKQFKGTSFGVKNVSFRIQPGSIVGFIGENGAGKSTTIGSILGTLRKDQGTIHVFGQEREQNELIVKEEIGVVFDSVQLPSELNVVQLERVFSGIYQQWSKETFFDYIEKFSLPRNKKIRSFSRGMSMKVSMAVALSHKAKLLLLDEATAGLDPSGREDLLQVLQEFVSDGERSILMSSHITSDIEKIADELIFIKGGEVLLDINKETFLTSYGVLLCSEKEMASIPKEAIVAYRKKEGGIEVLVSDKDVIPSTIKKGSSTIDDMTLILMKGVKA